MVTYYNTAHITHYSIFIYDSVIYSDIAHVISLRIVIIIIMIHFMYVKYMNFVCIFVYLHLVVNHFGLYMSYIYIFNIHFIIA